MSNTPDRELKIDPQFRDLIPPLSEEERKQLEDNLMAEGCRDPICIWNGTILDGHNRYEICTRRGIPFEVKAIRLRSRTEAVSWICANQLGRRNISEETRRYLIGKRYDAEKTKGARNKKGVNQASKKKKSENIPTSEAVRHHRTAFEMGNEYHVSHQTVQKYGAYSRAIDAIAKKHPDIVRRILSGEIRISHENIIEASHMPPSQLERFIAQCDNNNSFVPYKGSREILKKNRSQPMRPQPPKAEIKNMPKFDPDAEISSLSLTIPSWISSIERVKMVSGITGSTVSAREKLTNTLLDLRTSIDDMLECIKKEDK